MDKTTLCKAVCASLQTLYDNDSFLIFHNSHSSRSSAKHVAERAIVFRLGLYLEQNIRPYLCDSLYIDAEYNRNLFAQKIIQSRKKGSSPDLIIHERGSHSNNVLIIEVKTWWNPNQETDRCKIREYTDQNGDYKYKYGMLIFIGKNLCDVKIELYEDGCEQRFPN